MRNSGNGEGRREEREAKGGDGNPSTKGDDEQDPLCGQQQGDVNTPTLGIKSLTSLRG